MRVRYDTDSDWYRDWGGGEPEKLKKFKIMGRNVRFGPNVDEEM